VTNPRLRSSRPPARGRPHVNRDRGRFKPGTSGNPAGRPRGKAARPRHLPIADAVAAVQLATAGLSARRIAKLLNARPDAVTEALEGALKLLQLFAPEIALDWINASRNAASKGDHRPAMALLQSLGVVKPIPQAYDLGARANAVAGVKVEYHNFAFAGLPVAPATSSPTTAAPNDGTSKSESSGICLPCSERQSR
jgi:hypothetical protein